MQSPAGTYLLIIRDAPPETYDALPAEERLQGMRQWNAWVDGMQRGGRIDRADTLEGAGRVVGGARADRVMDGPFAEAKEMVGGYFLVRAADLDEATALARECPFLRYGMSIEIRPVAAACHLARSLGWETMEEPAA